MVWVKDIKIGDEIIHLNKWYFVKNIFTHSLGCIDEDGGWIELSTWDLHIPQ